MSVNMTGLVVGITACLLVMLFVHYETSYDKWLTEPERVYRVELSVNPKNIAPQKIAFSPPALVPAMLDKFPEVEKAGRLTQPSRYTFRSGQDDFELVVRGADPSILAILEFELEEGDAVTALSSPDSIVLTKADAKRLFPKQSAVGQTIQTEQGEVLKVTGIFRDIPANSHMVLSNITHMNSILTKSGPLAPFSQSLDQNWFSPIVYSYIKATLKPILFEAKLNEFLLLSTPAFKGSGRDGANVMTIEVMPVTDIYMNSRGLGQIKPPGDQRLMVSLVLVSFFVLGISLVNFVNLQLAVISGRIKEIGVRKILGASPFDILIQFLLETALLCFTAFFIAIALVELLLPSYGVFVGKEIPVTLVYNATFVFSGLALFSFVIFVGGAYPAYIVAKVKPASLFSSSSKRGSGRGGILRATMTTVQFGVTAFLITTTLVIIRQTEFSRMFSRGIETQSVYVLDLPRHTPFSRLQSLKAEILSLETATGVALVSAAPPFQIPSIIPVVLNEDRSKKVQVDRLFVDPNFQDVLGLKMLAGRWFSDDFVADEASNVAGAPQSDSTIILNKAAIDQLGLSANSALGKTVEVQNGFDTTSFSIIGVTTDINWRSTRDVVGPIMYIYDSSQPYTAMVAKVSTTDANSFIPSASEKWAGMFEEATFKYGLLSDRFEALTASEKQRGQLFLASSLIAILISCVGLFGMTTFFIERQNKEVALRKIFGASKPQVILLLMRRFGLPIWIALFGALPISYYYNQTWLTQFSQRVPLSFDIFFIAGTGVLFISVTTVISLILRLTKRRPAHVLYHE